MLNRLYSWYGKRVVNGVVAAAAVLLVIGIVVSKGGEDVPQNTTAAPRAVQVRPLSELGMVRTVEVIGTVRSVDEAMLQSETGGRVTRVPVALGDRVGPGAIIVEIENSSERATLIQAQGAYEAAQARAAQSTTDVSSAEVSLTTAESAGVAAYRAAFVAAEDAIRNTVDTVFSDPTGAIPGFRLASQGNAVAFTAERTRIETILDAWSVRVAANPESDTIVTFLAEAERDLLAIAQFIQQISEAAADKDNEGTEIGGVAIATIRTDLIGARSSIDGAYQNVQNKHLAIQQAENTLRNAEISGTTEDLSAANASVKQALGVLRSAESALSKTIVRAPFAGTINSLSVRVGDMVMTNASLGRLANNGSLEVIAFLNDVERAQITEGDTVMLEAGVSGVVTHVAPAIDPMTGKTEVRIGVSAGSSIQNGDTIAILLQDAGDSTNVHSSTSPLLVPIETLKMTEDGPVLFTVSAEGVLESHAVTMGAISGSAVAIETTLGADTPVVVDARGFKAGDLVTVTPRE